MGENPRMSFTDIKAVYGLSGIGTNTRSSVSGAATVGIGQTSMAIEADGVFPVRMIIADSGSEIDFNTLSGSTAGSTAWAQGAAQVETATVVAAGGITTNGTMTVTVTSAILGGGSVDVPVALTTAAHTSATLIATAIKDALNANASIAARYTAGSSGANVTLTVNPLWSTSDDSGGSLVIYRANDSSLNIAIPSGLGVTAAPTSANTTSGVTTTGTMVYDAGANFEGKTYSASSNLRALLVKGLNGIANIQSGTYKIPVAANQFFETASPSSALELNSTLTITAADSPCEIVLIPVTKIN